MPGLAVNAASGGGMELVGACDTANRGSVCVCDVTTYSGWACDVWNPRDTSVNCWSGGGGGGCRCCILASERGAATDITGGGTLLFICWGGCCGGNSSLAWELVGICARRGFCWFWVTIYCGMSLDEGSVLVIENGADWDAADPGTMIGGTL